MGGRVCCSVVDCCMRFICRLVSPKLMGGRASEYGSWLVAGGFLSRPSSGHPYWTRDPSGWIGGSKGRSG